MFKKRILKIIREFNRETREDIFLRLADEILAQDASLTNPRTPEERAKLKALTDRIDKSLGRHPERLKGIIELFVAENIGRWLTKITNAARQVCEWYVRNCAYDISRSQKSSFVAAGISEEVFKQRWTIPTIKRRYLSRNALAELPEMVKESTELITRMAADDLARTQEVITEGTLGEKSYSDIVITLEGADGFDEKRAARVALDQSNKVSQGIQRANCASLGIKEAVWIHVPGEYSSRETHIEMNGKKFDMNKGLFDSDVGRPVLPAELPYCRCICRPVIPAEFLGGTNEE